MKSSLITKSILILALAFPLGAIAQEGQTTTDQKAIKVSSFNSFKAYQEFQKNLNLINRQRERVKQLQAWMQAAPQVQRPDIRMELETVLAKLNENNRKMYETYGYSLTRNYTIITNQADLYMFVTPEEYEKWEAEQKTRDKKKGKKKGK